jgi:hypothetical protein
MHKKARAGERECVKAESWGFVRSQIATPGQRKVPQHLPSDPICTYGPVPHYLIITVHQMQKKRMRHDLLLRDCDGERTPQPPHHVGLPNRADVGDCTESAG